MTGDFGSMEVRLVETCHACPEQYDVFLGETLIGYLRLRGGVFTAEYPACGGVEVYRANPAGDGRFKDDERQHFLVRAKAALVARHILRGEVRDGE